MLVQLPLHYSIKCRLKRHRSSHNIDVYEWHEFDIPEVESGEAPIAVKDIMIGEQLTELRFFDDSLWTPEYKNSIPLDVDEWAANTLDKKVKQKSDGNSRLAKAVGCSGYWMHLFDEDEHRDITESSKGNSIGIYEAFLRNNIMLVDGVVYYRRETEPVFMVNASYSDVTTSVVYARSSFYGSEAPAKDSGIYFRLDRWDDMVSFVETKYTELKQITSDRPNILIDGIFDFRDEEISFMRQAKSIIDYHYSKLGSFPEEVGMAWYKLRDSYNGCSGFYDTTAEQIDEIIPHLNNFGTLIDAHEIKGGDAVSAVHERWMMRPIQIGAGFSF